MTPSFPVPPALPTPPSDLPPAPGRFSVEPPRGALGWLAHLLILTAWVVGSTAAVRFYTASGHGRPALGSVPELLRRLAVGTPVFAAFCLAAWVCSRASADQWRLRWRGGVRPVVLGAAYSVAMRLALGAVLVVLALLARAFHLLDARVLRELRPQVENAVSWRALVGDPQFFWVVVTVLSGSAGLLEEVWRGGMLAGWAGAFPRAFAGRHGPWLAIVPTALLFGLAHLYMGWSAVGMAALLGLMLGAITVWHRTIWPAVIAHALFDATSFLALVWVAGHTHLPGR